MAEHLSTAALLLGLTLLGALTWTLAEYLLHRFAGHVWRKNPFGAEHTRHHIEGGYFAPSLKKAAYVTPVAVAQTALFALWLPPAMAVAYGVGLWGGYVLYEVIHRRAHTHPPRHAYGRWRRRHHFWHHFGDARVNHGVSVPLWDHVFRTHRAPGVIKVPRKLAMPWLLDEAGELRPELREDYALRGR